MPSLSLTAKDIMTKDVISVRPSASVFEAHKILSRHFFNGLPIVDEQNHLVGILTEYDLLAQGSTIEGFLSDSPEDKEVYEKFQEGLKRVRETKVSEVMNTDPITFSEESTAQEIVKAFVEHHRVNPIPVVDKENKVVGIVSRYDALVLFYVAPDQ